MTSRAGQGGFANWQELRDHLIERYGATPHPAAEQEIIDAYQLHPSQVEKAALELIDAPNVTSPWGLLKAKAAKIASPPSNPTRNTAIDKERRIARAEQWIRTAGIHLDRQTELLLELFDDRGLLRPYCQINLIENGTTPEGHSNYELSEPIGDTSLVDRMTKLWDQHRPTGIALEQEAEERAAKWKAQHVKLRPPAPPPPEPETYETPPLPDIDYAAEPEEDPIPA